MDTERRMADNGQLDFRLKVFILELNSVCTATPAVASAVEATMVETAATGEATTIQAVTVSDYVTRTIETFEISRSDIEYRAEGNANIVLAIPQRCQVLRLPKKSKSIQNICRSTAKECRQNGRIFYVYKYIDRVSELFGQNISSRPILVRIEFCNVDAFNVWLHNHRPKHRIQHNNRDDFDFDYGLLYHDACSLNLNLESMKAFCMQPGGDVFAVEIKPKQGWNICSLPEWILELFEICPDIRRKCRFCAMQYLKVKGHEVQQLSKYCPLDLFSGDELRMKKSIRNLIACPQNNFRVFRNGQLLYGDGYQAYHLQSTICPCFGNNSNSMENFISLLVNILQYDFVNRIDRGDYCPTTEPKDTIAGLQAAQFEQTDCMPISPSHLQAHSILKCVFNRQILAKKTIPYVAQNYINGSNGWEDLLENDQWPHSHVTEFCRKLNQSDASTVDLIDYEYLNTACKLNDEEIYEIGATALDCSIMLTFQNIGKYANDDFGCPFVTINGQRFAVNATVFDLDPKLYPRHFSKYVQKTRDSFNAFKLYLNSKGL